MQFNQFIDSWWDSKGSTICMYVGGRLDGGIAREALAIKRGSVLGLQGMYVTVSVWSQVEGLKVTIGSFRALT